MGQFFSRYFDAIGTHAGLSVTVDILAGIDETGRKVLDHLKPTLNFTRDAILLKLNDTDSLQS